MKKISKNFIFGVCPRCNENEQEDEDCLCMDCNEELLDFYKNISLCPKCKSNENIDNYDECWDSKTGNPILDCQKCGIIFILELDKEGNQTALITEEYDAEAVYFNTLLPVMKLIDDEFENEEFKDPKHEKFE